MDLLIHAWVNPNLHNLSGWSPKEHAAFRGHLEVAERLAAAESTDSSPKFCNSYLSKLSSASDLKVREDSTAELLKPSGLRRPQYNTIRTEFQIFVTLGSSNTRKNTDAVRLESNGDCAMIRSNGFSLEFCAIGATVACGSSNVIPLPLLGNIINEPWYMWSEELKSVKVLFRISKKPFPSDLGTTLVGSGIALLSYLNGRFTSQRESLVHEYTVALIGKVGNDAIDTVTFSPLVVTPFFQQRTITTKPAGFWLANGPTQVVGHREDATANAGDFFGGACVCLMHRVRCKYSQ